MRALIAQRTSQNLATCNDTLKHVRKGKQLSIAQTSGSRPRRQHIREHFREKACVRRYQFAGLGALARR